MTGWCCISVNIKRMKVKGIVQPKTESSVVIYSFLCRSNLYLNVIRRMRTSNCKKSTINYHYMTQYDSCAIFCLLKSYDCFV